MGTFINSPKCLLHHANIPNLTKSRTPYPSQAEFDADMQRAFSQPLIAPTSPLAIQPPTTPTRTIAPAKRKSDGAQLSPSSRPAKMNKDGTKKSTRRATIPMPDALCPRHTQIFASFP